MTKQVILWLALVTLAPAAGADPSPAVRYLMQEPMTMMDWGLLNIERRLDACRTVLTHNGSQLFEANPFISAQYDWDENRIAIMIRLQLKAGQHRRLADMHTVRSHLELLVTYVRGLLTLAPFDAFFRHKGDNSPGAPRDMEVELTGITELIIDVRDEASNVVSRCRAPLIGTQIHWPAIGE